MGKKAGEENYIRPFGLFGLILFYISFIPYLMLVWVAAAGTDTFFGGDMYNRMEYGFRAVAYMGRLLSLMIPVIPVCLIYQMIFGFLYISKRPSEIRKPAVIYSAVFAALILTPCLFHSGREFIYTHRHVPEIRAFLSDKYGEKVAKECRIELEDIYYEEFTVYSPIFSDDDPFTVSRDRDGSFDDHGNMILAFANENEGFSEELNNYIDEKYDLPDNMHSGARCTDIEFGDFRYGDDYSALIPTAEYTIDRLYVELDDVDQETLEKLLIDIWKEQCPKFMDSLEDSLVIIVSADGQVIANLQITMPIPENHNLPVGSIGVLDEGERLYGLKDEAFYI